MKTAKISTKKIVMLKKFDNEFKTPQIRVMLSVLETIVPLGEPILHTELLNAIDNHNDFISCQGSRLVWGFYQNKLISAGLIKITN